MKINQRNFILWKPTQMKTEDFEKFLMALNYSLDHRNYLKEHCLYIEKHFNETSYLEDCQHTLKNVEKLILKILTEFLDLIKSDYQE